MAERDGTLHGCWQLVSFHAELQQADERVEPWGVDPNGTLVFDPAGRMMVLVTARVREPGNPEANAVALFRTMMAYSGRYRIDEERFIVKIDASWNEAWNGSEQERFYKLDGDMLDVSTAWMPNPLVPGNPTGRATLRFRRETAS